MKYGDCFASRRESTGQKKQKNTSPKHFINVTHILSNADEETASHQCCVHMAGLTK